MWGLYGLLAFFMAAAEWVRGGFSLPKLLLPTLFLLLHVSYGVGTLVGLIELPFWLRRLKRQAACEAS